MPDEFYHNGLADKAPSGGIMDRVRSGVSSWWNGLGQDMASKAQRPLWGETQWRGPEGYNYIPFPEKGSDAAEAGLTALLGLAAVRAGRFPEHTVDMGMARANPMQEPNPAVMARMQRGLHGAPENDAGTVLSAVQPVRYPDYRYQYPESGIVNDTAGPPTLDAKYGYGLAQQMRPRIKGKSDVPILDVIPGGKP